MADDLVERGLKAEQERGARLLVHLRFAALSLGLPAVLFVGLVLKSPTWRFYVGPSVLWWVVSGALVLLLRLRPTQTAWAAYSAGVVDVPMVCALQYGALEVSDLPGAIPGYALALFCSLVGLSALSLRRSVPWVVAGLSIVAQLFLLEAVDASRALSVISALVLLVLAAAGSGLYRLELFPWIRPTLIPGFCS
jgi:adenylate cyclase